MSQVLDDSQLKRMVHEYLRELEKFPRKNRHSLEWFEKYHSKFMLLKEKQS